MHTFAAEQMMLCYLEMLLISFMRRCGAHTGKTPSRVIHENGDARCFNEIIRIIVDNPGCIFTIEELCQRAMFSKSALEKLFIRNTGMSVIKYCRYRKVEQAKKYLREDVMNVTQIAEKLGFSSIHYFSRTFRQFVGMSPNEYAASVRSIIDHTPLTAGIRKQ
jgi:AraC-like DNA-binding protein